MSRLPQPDHSEVVAALDWWVAWHGDAESVSIPDIATLAAAARVYAHETESSRWGAFPTDENVAAFKARLIRLGQNLSLEDIRVALEAVRARETGET